MVARKLNVLFWNIKKGIQDLFTKELDRNNALLSHLEAQSNDLMNKDEVFLSFIHKEDIALILFAEFPTKKEPKESDDEKKKKEIEANNKRGETILKILKSYGYDEVFTSDTKIKGFVRTVDSRWKVLGSPESRMSFLTVSSIETPNLLSLLCVAVHLDDAFNNEPQVRLIKAIENRRIIDKYIEDNRLNHTPILILGDFNMNPFDFGMNTKIGFHAMHPTEKNIKKNSKGFPLINYSWKWLAGNSEQTVFGTHQYKTEEANFNWHTLDQVLCAPCLKVEKCFPIYEINDREAFEYSDHLPIFVSLIIP